MAKADVLDRVRQDLAAGRTYPATQRLRTLLASYPDDLEIYRLLAAVYRQTGNFAEAGRWAFLTVDARPEELAAFTRSNPDPWARLRLIRWQGDPSELADDEIRNRLGALVEEAEKSGPPTRWVGSYRAPDRTRGVSFPCLFTVISLIIVGTLIGIGALRILLWLVD